MLLSTLRPLVARPEKQTMLPKVEYGFDQDVSMERLRVNSALFLCAFVYSLVTGLLSHLPGRRRVAFVACAIHALAGMSYLLMGNNWAPILITSNTGRPLVLMRLIEWSCTVPNLLTLIGWLVDVDARRVNAMRTRMFLCLMVGGLGPLFPYPINWLMYFASCYLQLLVMLTLHGYFAGLHRKLRNNHDRRCIRVAHTLVLAIFVVYPIIWALAVELQRMDLATEMNAFATTDITAKLVLTSVLSNMTAAAYDYALVDFPEYFRTFVNSITVPAFALDENNVVTHWNQAMETLTGRPAGSVLYAKADKTEAFTSDSLAALRSLHEMQLVKRTSSKQQQQQAASSSSSSQGPAAGGLGADVDASSFVVHITFKLKGNPQDTHQAPFYVMDTTTSTGRTVLLVEASANAGYTHQAVKLMAKQLRGDVVLGKGGAPAGEATWSPRSSNAAQQQEWTT